MAITKIGSGFIAQDKFERPYPSHGAGSIVTFPGANLQIAGASGSRYLAAFPAQETTYSLISQGQGTPDYMIQADVRNDTIEERSGIIFRGFIPGVDMFELRLEHDQTGAKNKVLALYGPASKYAGSVIRLATTPYAWPLGAFTTIRAVITGNNIKAWIVAPGNVSLVAPINYTVSFDLPATLGVFGVTGGTFLVSGSSLNGWDNFKVFRSNRYKVTNLPASHKIRVNGTVGADSLNGIAYFDLRGGPADWDIDLEVLNAANAVVATFGSANLDPGDIFDSGISGPAAGTAFFEGFGGYESGQEIGTGVGADTNFLSHSSIPELAAPWVVSSGVRGAKNNRVLQHPGPWSTTALRWVLPGTAVDQDLLIRFRKVGNVGDVVKLRANIAGTRGVTFGIETGIEPNGSMFGDWSTGSAFLSSRTNYRLYIREYNSDTPPYPLTYSPYIQLFDGEFYLMRVRVIGLVAYARIWKVDQEEPTSWQVQAPVTYNTAGYVDFISGFYSDLNVAIDSVSLGINGVVAVNQDDISTIPNTPVISVIPGAQRLTFFEDDDITPIIGLVDPRDGRIIEASVSSHPEDPRPYLNPIDEHSDVQIALKEGSASIGQLNWSFGDKRTVALDQRTGWYTALLSKGLLNHRCVFQQMTINGDWETIIDGVGGPPSLRDNLVEYSGSIKSLQEREREVRVFTKTFFSILPVGLPDGYGSITEQKLDLPTPDAAFHQDSFDGVPGTLLQAYTVGDPPFAYWTKHASFAFDAQISSLGRVFAVPTAGNSALYYITAALASADYEAETSLTRRGGVTAGRAGVAVRVNTGADTRYSFEYDASLNQFQVRRNLAGASVVLGTKDYALIDDLQYKMKIRVVGTTITAYIEDSLVLTITDANIAAAGRGGIVFSNAVSTESAGLHLDNFRMNDLTTVVARYNVTGGLLVRPVTPLRGKFTLEAGSVNKGVIAIDWRASGFADDQWEKYSDSRWDDLQRFNFSSSVYNANSGEFDFRHQGVTVRWTTDWVEGKPVKWNYLRDMALGDIELFITNQSPGQFLPQQGNFKLTHVKLQSDDLFLLPANAATVFFEIISERAPTEDEPLMFTENIGRLAQRILDGEFRNAGTPIIPYDYAAMMRFIAETPISNIKITAPWENMWEDMGQHIYKPFGYVPVINGRGEITVRSVDFPDAKYDLPVINDNMVESARWVEGSEDLMTVGEFVYYRDFLAPQDTETPKSDWERLQEREVRLVRIADSYSLHKEHKTEYTQDTIRSVTSSNFGVGDIAHEVGALVGNERLRKSITRFSDGADRCLIVGKASDPVIAALRNADWVNASISWLPDRATGIRGLDRVMQVIQLKSTDPLRRSILLVDAGAFNIPVPLATVGAVATLGNRRVRANVTALPTVNGSPATIVLQYSLNATLPNPDTTDAQWVTFSQDAKTGEKLSHTLPLAARSFIRYRTEAAGRRPSKWTVVSAPQVLTTVPVATGLGMTYPADPTTATLGFTPPNALVESWVYLRFLEQGPDKAVRQAIVSPGAGAQSYVLTGLVPGVSYIASVRSHDVTTDDLSEPTELSFNANNVTIGLVAPTTASPFTRYVESSVRRGISRLSIFNNFVNGLFGLAVIASEFPGFVDFEVAVETGVGTGAYGAFTPMQSGVPSVQGDWTIGSSFAVTNDRLRRKMRARHVRLGATPSAWTPEQIVTPWTAVPLTSASSFSSISGLPTTIAGYGITDYNSLGDARWARLANTNHFLAYQEAPDWVLTGSGGGGGGSSASPIIVYDEGVLVSSSLASLNFVGSGVTVTSDGSNNLTVTVTSNVTSVFGRTGVIVANSGDYTFAQIGAKPSTIGGYGITDFNSLGDARWLKLSGGTMTGNLFGVSIQTSNSITAGPAGSGQVTLAPGDTGAIGYIEWRTPAGVRQGYMGYGSSGITINMEAGVFGVVGNTLLTGALTVTGRVIAQNGDGQSVAAYSARGTNAKGNAFEWGHANTGGYGSALAWNVSSGDPYLIFYGEAGTTANTYRTRGIRSVIYRGTGSGHSWGTVVNASADNQSYVELASLSLGGVLTVSDGLNVVSTTSEAIASIRETSGRPYGVTIENRNNTRRWALLIDAVSVDDGFFAIVDRTGGTVPLRILTDGRVQVIANLIGGPNWFIGSSSGYTVYTSAGDTYLRVTSSGNTVRIGDDVGNVTIGAGNGGVALFLSTGTRYTGISFYSTAYTAWQMYMAPSGTGSVGIGQNMTAPSGLYVTSWAIRSFVESVSTYGWTWECGTAFNTTPTMVAELSTGGNFRTTGIIRSTQTYGWAIGAIGGVPRVHHGSSAANAFSFLTSGDGMADVYMADLHIARNNATGAIYFGDQTGGARYIYYDGSTYTFANVKVIATDFQLS